MTLPQPAGPAGPAGPAAAAAPAPAADGQPHLRRVLAVIPARGGSKGVPAKNLAKVGGLPLVVRAVRECLAAREVTDVVVSTDDPTISAAAEGAGAAVVHRPADLAGDLATSEAAVLHAMDGHEARQGGPVDAVLLVQCTSPFLTHEDLDGVAAALRRGADSALTVAPFHGFVWRDGRPGPAGHGDATGPRRAGQQSGGQQDGNGGALGVNHDKSHRPRRQDRPEDLLETGAVYGMDAAGFRKAGHRFFGHTELVRSDPARTLEVDDPHELARARALAPLLDTDRQQGEPPAAPGHRPADAAGEVGHVDAGAELPGEAGARAWAEAAAAPRAPASRLPTRDDIDAVVLDFDGTQTDDRVFVDSEGRELVAVHRGDGLGIAALRRSGLALLTLSTEQNPVVAARAAKLKIPVLHGIDRKDLALSRWCDERGIAPERVLYAGNDVNDLPCLRLVGWPVAVAGSQGAVCEAARAVTHAPGGEGAIREIASWLLGPTL